MQFDQDPEFRADDPGNVLREALNRMKPPSARLMGNLQELAYTAQERGLLVYRPSSEDFEVLLRLVTLASSITTTLGLKKYRM